MTMALEHVRIGGLKIVTAARAELTGLIIADCLERRSAAAPGPPRLLFDANGHGMSLAASDPAFRAALSQAHVVHADGGFIVLASRHVAGAAIRGRSATTDLIHDFIGAGLADGVSHYLLGGTEQVNAACAARLQQMYPGIRIVGRRNGFFSADEETDVIAGINAAAPDIVWLGLGKPREQMVSIAARERLNAGWLVTCGGCFNYITGDYPRAPQWMQDGHVEWVFRAVTTPRLLWRYITTSPHAIWLTLTRRDRTVARENLGR